MTNRSMMNVILITLDDFGYELFAENIDSLPILKVLKSQSISFENAFSSGPTTNFAFPGIIAGVYPYHFGIGIDKNVKAIDEILKTHGYNTAMINHANLLLTPYFGYGLHMDYLKHITNLPEGEIRRKIEDTLLCGEQQEEATLPLWQLYSPRLLNIIMKLQFLWKRNRWMRSFGTYCLNAHRFLKLYYWRREGITLNKHRELYNSFRDEIFDFVNGRFSRPQFLWIHTVINHLPYLPISSGSKFTSKQVDYLNTRGVAIFVNHKICAKLKGLYIESLKMTDTFIGDIIGALKLNGLLNDSIIVVTADHGEEFMEKGYFGHDAKSSSDRLLHVPLLFYCPDLIKAKIVSTPVSTLDILPTICDMLGIDIPDTTRGTSLRQIMISPEEGAREDSQRPLFSEAWHAKSLLDRSPGHMSNQRIFTIRKGTHKLKFHQLQDSNNQVVEKLELTDWVNKKEIDIVNNQEIVEQLKQLLNIHIYEEGVFAQKIRLDAEKQKIRKAVGRMQSSS